MSRRDELIAKYAADLKEKCGIAADMPLLTKVTIGCGPSIYSDDASVVSTSDKGELERLKENFLIKKLGLKDGPDLDAGIAAVISRRFILSLCQAFQTGKSIRLRVSLDGARSPSSYVFN